MTRNHPTRSHVLIGGLSPSRWALSPLAQRNPRAAVLAVRKAGVPSMTNRPEEQEQGDVATETRKEVRRPPLFKVLLHNDDFTTQDFVVFILRTIFHQPQELAYQIMMHVHQRGIGVAGLFPFETAEAKVQQVHSLARDNEYPLKCSIEPE